MIVYQGKYIRVVKENEWESVQRTHRQEAVVILAVNDDQKLILVEQYRPPVKAYVIELPAGLLGDPGSALGEADEEAARRELLEETGYLAEEMEFLAEGPPSAGLSAEKALLFQAHGLQKTHAGGGVENENITVHEISLPKIDGWLQGMEAQGKLVDIKVYAGLYFLKQGRKS